MSYMSVRIWGVDGADGRCVTSVAGKWGGWDILGAVQSTAANGKRHFDAVYLNIL